MVHTFTALGVHVAVDVNSGAVHVLDQLLLDLLEQVQPPMGERCPDAVKAALPQYDPAELDEAWAELKELQDNGLLFEEDDYIDPADAVQEGAPIKALCLNVAHDCNLRCKYCFASQGGYGTGTKLMSPEVAKAAIDFVAARSGKRRNIEVDFFGGEPMMALDTVKATVEYARGMEERENKHFRFTMTTNGVLLDEENTAYFNREMKNCVLSLDGRKEVNDAMRIFPNGTGSYDTILPHFKRLVAQRGDQEYYLRGTFTRENLDFAADVQAMAEEGFRQISVEPCVGPNDDPFAIREEDVPQCKAEYEKLARYLLHHPEVNFFHFNVDLSQGPCVIKRMRGCGAGAEYVAVTPEGDIYPCHQFVGKAEYKMGNVLDGTFDGSIADQFANLNIYTREDCKTCWARFYCSGGCSAANLNANGDLKKPAHVGCELQRKRLECAIAMQAIRSGLADMPEETEPEAQATEAV